jgi:hypothetical protein
MEERHTLAEHADGRWVGALILATAAFWIGVIWMIWRWVD